MPNPKIAGFWRQIVTVQDINGETSGEALDDAVIVAIDREGNGMVGDHFRLAFADYPGLQAEWEAGAATTVLQAAIDSVIAAAEWPGGDNLSDPVKGLIGLEVVI